VAASEIADPMGCAGNREMDTSSHAQCQEMDQKKKAT